MDFVENWYIERQRKEVAIDYMSEMLRLTVNNTAVGEKRYTMDMSLRDLLEPPSEEQRTSEEIIENIKRKLENLGA